MRNLGPHGSLGGKQGGFWSGIGFSAYTRLFFYDAHEDVTEVLIAHRSYRTPVVFQGPPEDIPAQGFYIDPQTYAYELGVRVTTASLGVGDAINWRVDRDS